VLREDVRLLLAAAPNPFTSTALPAAQQEVEEVSNIIPPHLILPRKAGMIVESGPSFVCKAEEVLQLLPEATILHLACHGLQTMTKPLGSGFVMHDKMVHIGDIIRLNLPNARLAFLSACDTAQGDMEQPDEAIHLAAAILYAGFKSVVATMWSMGDIDGPLVAKTV
jgi:CHAT domain-containing protein